MICTFPSAAGGLSWLVRRQSRVMQGWYSKCSSPDMCRYLSLCTTAMSMLNIWKQVSRSSWVLEAPAQVLLGWQLSLRILEILCGDIAAASAIVRSLENSAGLFFIGGSTGAGEDCHQVKNDATCQGQRWVQWSAATAAAETNLQDPPEQL